MRPEARGPAASGPVYVPEKTAEPEVVIPGLTGLPSRPGERDVDRGGAELGVETADDVAARAVELELDVRARRPLAGTTTQGPTTGTQICRPLHSRVAADAAGARRARSAASTSAVAQKTRLHGTS